MDDVKYTKKVTAFNDDDIPYEVRMKHIIEAYRKDLKRLEALEKYAKGLEERWRKLMPGSLRNQTGK